MAQAPTPGARQRAARRAKGKNVIVTVDGVEHTLALPLVTAEQRALRNEAGLSMELLVASTGGIQTASLDTLSVFLWLARRQGGEDALRLAECDALIDGIVAECEADPAAISARLSVEMVSPDDPRTEGDPES